MRIDLKLDGLGATRKTLDRLSGPQARQAYAAALNDAAYQVRRVMRNEMLSVFDRPTPYVVNSVYVRQATPERLEATIEPTYYGGKGIDPQRILQAQSFGGTRRDKRSEVALRRAGILPSGYQTAIPRNPYPGSDDGRGNLRGAFIVQLISYFQAFGEQGYRANMRASRKAAIHAGSARQAGRRYFVASGRLRSGKTAHLAPGIWAASGTGGVDVRPVLMFVRASAYRMRLSMDNVSRKAGTDEYLQRRLRYRIRQVAGE
ncbi:hypothetical protein [Variovorax sp. 38R]|uniref:hypothetical protein n=1 Tax=Variovorax sp. 38R TaxID=2774875 RepID=UPI0017836D3A|nr:hypothetical protein [Variovorax sp. 38R]QOF80320.1 hypothetical protein IG196_08015 [Variovorax sp. 38R]